MKDTQNQKAGRSYKPTLSLCMIVKNEAENLEKCLSLARPHVDEIVIVDTGSTDGTLDIARRYADVLEEIEWPGSFSDARNHSLELASGDYILILDGDEYIDSLDSWNKIRNSLGVLDIAALILPVKNLLSENNVVSADMFWQERVLRNHPDIRYHGSVHNQVMEAIWAHAERTGRHIARLDAEIIHTGYSLPEEEMVQKYKTRVDLLKAEYENPRDEVYKAYYAYQLGLIYYIMRLNEEAAELFNTLDYEKLTPENAFYTRLLGAQTALRLNDLQAALVHCNEMLRINPNEPVGYYLTGVSLMRSSFYKDGMLMLLQAYHVNNSVEQFIRFVINPKILLEHLLIACRSLHLTEHVKMFEDLLKEEDYESDKVKASINLLQTLLAQTEGKSFEEV